MNYCKSINTYKEKRKANIAIESIFQIAIIFYIFSIFFSTSSGEILVKLSRVFVVGVWLVYLLKQNRLKIEIRYYYVWAFCFLLYHFLLSNLYAINSSSANDYLMTVFYVLFVNCIILSFLLKNRQFAYVIIKCISIFAAIGGLRIFITYGFDYYFNSRGAEVNGNGIGYMCAIGAVIALYVILNSPKRSKERYIYAFLFVFNVVLAVLTASRKVYLYLGIPIVFYLIVSSKNLFKLLRNILFAIILLIIAYFLIMKIEFLYDLVGYRLESMIMGFLGEETDASTLTRMHLIQYGIKWFSANPVWGYGLNGFSILNGINNPNDIAYYAHNNFIEMLVDGGLVGFILYYLLYLVLLIAGIKKVIKKDKTAVFFFGILLSQLVCDYGQVSYYETIVQLMLLLCYFFIMQQTHNNKKFRIRF